MQYTEENDKRWLSAIVVSFLVLIFITLPLEVVIASLIQPHCNQEKSRNLENINETTTRTHIRSEISKANIQSKFRENIFTLALLSMVLWTAYDAHTDQAFRVKSNMEKIFVGFGHDNDFTKITSVEKFWNWTEFRLVPGLRNQWYSGNKTDNLWHFLRDKVSRIIGEVAIRQVRSKPDSCINDNCPFDLSPCNCHHGPNFEDKWDYHPGWSLSGPSYEHRIEYHYQLSSAPSINGKLHAYSSSGYIFSLMPYPMIQCDPIFVNATSAIRRLQNENWIDKYTRAIIVDICAYNYQADIFVVMQYLIEIPMDSHLFISTYNIRSMLFTSLESDKNCFYIHWTSQSVFIFVFIYIIKQGWTILKNGAEVKLYDPWFYIDFSLFICSITAIIFHFLLLQHTDQFFTKLQESYDNPESCTILQQSANADSWLTIFISLVVFFTTLKLIRIFPLTSFAGVALQHMISQFIGLLIFFIIFYSSFLSFCYLSIWSGYQKLAHIGYLIQSIFSLKLRDFWDTASLVTWASVAFSLFLMVIFNKLASALVISAYNSVRRNNGKRKTIFDYIEEFGRKVSRIFLCMYAPDTALEVPNEQLQMVTKLALMHQCASRLVDQVEQLCFDDTEVDPNMEEIERSAHENVIEDNEMVYDPTEPSVWVVNEDIMFRVD